jgi:hopanoid biosynthesis associated protein HpnK
MERPEAAARLIVNADDFGRSRSINEAVIRAHREGILTTASLMVNGHACAEAVELAHAHPTLGVGLHLALVCGRSALKPTEIPGLVDNRFEFSDRPALAGLRYFCLRSLRPQLRQEIHTQIKKFQLTGLPMDHLNGHLNMHLHPTIFSILRHHALEWGIRSLRVTRDPFWLNAQLAGGQWLYRSSHAIIFTLLCWRARGLLRRRHIRFTDRVFGLLQNARVDEAYVLRLLPRLQPGNSELYSHPSVNDFKHELDALVSPRVKALVQERGIQLIRYQDLP